MTTCHVCGAADCAHPDLEYAGLVPPRATETRPGFPPVAGSGRAAPEYCPPLNRRGPHNHGEAHGE